MIKAARRAGGYCGLSGGLLAMPLPDDKGAQVRQALSDFTLLGVTRHALVVGGDLQHLIARVLQAQTIGHRAALKRALSASSAFRYGNR
jgi:hypothetical protein